MHRAITGNVMIKETMLLKGFVYIASKIANGFEKQILNIIPLPRASEIRLKIIIFNMDFLKTSFLLTTFLKVKIKINTNV